MKIEAVFGRGVRLLRTHLGYSQERFAVEIMGMDRVRGYQIENGKVDIRLSTADRIASALSLGVEDILRVGREKTPDLQKLLGPRVPPPSRGRPRKS